MSVAAWRGPSSNASPWSEWPAAGELVEAVDSSASSSAKTLPQQKPAQTMTRRVTRWHGLGFMRAFIPAGCCDAIRRLCPCSKEIADEPGIGLGTVNTYVRHIYE